MDYPEILRYSTTGYTTAIAAGRAVTVIFVELECYGDSSTATTSYVELMTGSTGGAVKYRLGASAANGDFGLTQSHQAVVLNMTNGVYLNLQGPAGTKVQIGYL